MKSSYFIALCCILSASCGHHAQEEYVHGPGKVHYPATRTVDTVFNHFGTMVPDPYNWLEADANTDTSVHNWIQEENEVTNNYLSQIPYRDDLKKRLTELADYPKESAPFREGDYYFYTRNNGLQNQSVTYYKKGLDGEERVFLDPNTLSADGTVTQSLAGFSPDRKYVAVTENKAGSDWANIYVKDVAANSMLPDSLEWTKFSGAAWYHNGFYYSGYDKPGKDEYTASTQHMKVFYHVLGTDQSKDKLVYQDPAHANYYFSAQTTDDGHYLLIYISPGTSGSEIWWQDLSDPHGKLQLLFKGFSWEYTVLDNDGDKLIVLTNYEAPNYRIVKVDPKDPSPEKWKDLVAEQKQVLYNVSLAGGKIFAFYLKDVNPVVVQFNRSGEEERQIMLPSNGVGGTLSGFEGEKDDVTLFFSFTTFLSPADIYQYDIRKGTVTLYHKAQTHFNADRYEMKQVFYTSKDGTKVPMFLVYKKGIKLDGSNPCLLYGYGGFNIPILPNFNPSRIALLEQGFIYASANIRGGSEYGEAWHKAAMFEKKQNVFDDFIAAAEYLVDAKYTSSPKLAILGRSNGGLLIGACMTQRPDLYAVALPGVGVLDMLRYQRFTVGKAWAVEYGNADSSKEAFDYLYKYSPLQNVHPGTKYPATFITTADHDDRVVPAHSFKFTATLQAAQAGDNPVLIRVETQAGHGGGKPLSKTIDEDADWMSFTMWNVGIRHFNPPAQ